MSTLAQSDRTKLAKLLGLLSSDHAGERDAAATAACRFLKTRNVSWEDLLAPTPVARRVPAPATWQEACARLLQHPRQMSAWENRFVADLQRLPRISPKQKLFLDEISIRVLGVGL